MPTHLGGWGAVAAATLALPTVRPAPVTVKYRVDQSLTQEVDATSAGQGKQTLQFTTSTFVTVTLTDSAGGRTMKVVIDSVKGDSTAPIPPDKPAGASDVSSGCAAAGAGVLVAAGGGREII